MKSVNIKLFVFLFIVIAVQAFWIANSDGFYFIDDSCHFNYNRHFFDKYYAETFGSWSRLGRVLLFAFPSLIGLKAVQIFSSFIFIITILISYKIAELQNIKNAEWIILLIGFQPALFNISYTVLAELPAAFLIVLSYYFYVKNRPASVLITSSLIFIFRTEYFFVCLIYVLVYLYKKNWKVIPLLITGPLLWYIHSFAVSRNPYQFFHDLGVHSQLPRITEGVDWYYYLLRIPQIFGVLQTLLFIISLFLILYKKEFKNYTILLMIFFGAITVHTLAALKGFNVSPSVGQLRYVAVVGPVFGIIAVFSAGMLFENLKRAYLRYTVITLTVLFIFLTGPFMTPFHKKLRIEEDSEKIAEMVRNEYPGYKVLSSLHFIPNAFDEPKTGGETYKELTMSNLKKYDKTIIVFLKELENDPFVGETTRLSDIESILGVRLLYVNKAKVNRDSDVPVLKYFYNILPEFKKEFVKYMVADQYTWEEYEMRVFIKN